MYSNPIQYVKVPHEVIFDTNLTPTEKVVYLALCAFDVNESGIVNNLKYEKLGELVGLSRSRTKQVVNKLVEKGYVVKHVSQQIQENGKIIYNGTRNIYILPKKITFYKLLKLSTKVENLPPQNENKPLDNDNLSTEGDKKETPIYSIDNTDDDIEKEINKLKQKEGEEVVSKALTKMGKYTINKKGFIAYLIKTIDSMKKYTYSKINTYVHKNNSKKPSTFNNFRHRNYDFSKLKSALLGWSDVEYSDCLIE